MSARWTSRLLLLLIAVDAFARAGGGGGYSGGGEGSSSGGSFSSSSGGSGGDGLVTLVLWLVLQHPLIGVPLVLIAAYLLTRGGSTVNEIRIDRQIERGLGAEGDIKRGQALARIRQRDPGFVAEAFLSRVSGAFLAIQAAWSRQDMAPARGFVSDGVFERFGRQIAEQKEVGYRNSMSDVRVLETEALGYVAGDRFDSVFVRIKASALDQDIALDDGRVLRGGPDVFTEVWTFLRRPGAKTLGRPGLLEGYCPSCGAPLPIADAAQCGVCKAWVNSGEHDWVLVEVTQVCEWSFPSPEREVTGWQALRETDPGLSFESLEDRASVAFWRWLEARRHQASAPLGGMAAPEFLASLAFDGTAEQGAAVGAVTTIAFEPGADFDKVHVLVKWEAEKLALENGSTVLKGRQRRSHFFIFRRKSGVTSDPRAGLRTSRCPACGAPPERPDAVSCAYCGQAFNDGSRSWVLTDIVPFGVWRRPDEGPDTPMEQMGLDWGEEVSPVDAVAVLVVALAADGAVADRERIFLEAYAQKRGVNPAKVDELIQAALGKRLDAPRPADGAQGEAMLRGLIRMSLADGRVSDAERGVLSSFGRRCGLKDTDVALMVKEERLALQARAKAALAARRG